MADEISYEAPQVRTFVGTEIYQPAITASSSTLDDCELVENLYPTERHGSSPQIVALGSQVFLNYGTMLGGGPLGDQSM